MWTSKAILLLTVKMKVKFGFIFLKFLKIFWCLISILGQIEFQVLKHVLPPRFQKHNSVFKTISNVTLHCFFIDIWGSQFEQSALTTQGVKIGKIKQNFILFNNDFVWVTVGKSTFLYMYSSILEKGKP